MDRKNNATTYAGAGKEIDVEELVTLASEDEAKEFFIKARDRLRSVNKWSEIAGKLSAEFHLTDSNGQAVQRFVSKGDFIRIDIPGPGSESGNGYDWVQIEEVTQSSTEDEDVFFFRVRPASNPLGNPGEIAHFYSVQSTSTFLINRIKKTILGGIYDQNVTPNDETETLGDKVRHQVIGTAGLLAFSKLQWTMLIKAILKQ